MAENIGSNEYNSSKIDQTSSNSILELKDGSLYFRDKKTFLITGEFPYYRLAPDKWAHRLDVVKKIGVNIVTFNVPWNFHENEDNTFDFFGVTDPKKNLARFLDLIYERNMFAIPKIGPFCGGEIRHGGISTKAVEEDLSCLMKNREGEFVYYPDGNRPSLIKRKPLPSYLHPNYLKHVKRWYQELSRSILKKYSTDPKTIIAVQVENEIPYSNVILANPFSWGYDYFALYYNEWIQKMYHTIEEYNEFHDTLLSSFDAVKPPKKLELRSKKNWLIYQDWIRAKEDYIADVLDTYAKILKDEGVDVVLYHNLLMMEDFAPTNYYDMSKSIWLGANFWSGDVKNERLELFDDQDDYVTVALRCKLLKGTQVNLPMIAAETNWGWAGQKYSNFLTRLTIAYELDGTNFYTLLDTNNAVGYTTEREPYPGNSPIDFEGRIRKKARKISRLVSFLDVVGERLSNARARADICIGYYHRYNDHALFVDPLVGEEKKTNWNAIKSTFKDVANANWAAKSLLKSIITCDMEFDVIDIRHCEYVLLEKYKAMIVPSFDYMDKKTQENLVRYVKNGGLLICTPRVPYLDLNMKDCTILRDEIFPAPANFEAYKQETFDVSWDRYGIVKSVWWSDSFNLNHVEDAKVLARLPNGEVCAYMRKIGKGSAIMVGTGVFVHQSNAMFFNWLFETLGIIAKKAYVHDTNVELVERISDHSNFIFIVNMNSIDSSVHAKVLNKSQDSYLDLKTVIGPHSVNIIELEGDNVVSASLDSPLGSSALIGHRGLICTSAAHPTLTKVNDTVYRFFAEQDTEVIFSVPKEWQKKSVRVLKVYSDEKSEDAGFIVDSEIRFMYETNTKYFEIIGQLE